MTRLCELALKYDTDKCPEWRGGTGHEYTPFYSEQLRGRTIKRVLEIGICTGASLRMWAEYFPRAEIWGIDSVPETMFNADRIHTLICDQADTLSLIKTRNLFLPDTFDLMIDDGSHRAEDQILSAQILSELLTLNGLYIIEDVQQENWGRVWMELVGTIPLNYHLTRHALRTDKRSDNRLIVIERMG